MSGSNKMKEMVGGCCVCSDERGWAENPLVYCDGHGCNVAVHQGLVFFLNIFVWFLFRFINIYDHCNIPDTWSYFW